MQYLPEFMPVSRSGIEAQVYMPIIEDSLALADEASLVSDQPNHRAWQAIIEFTTEPEALLSLSRLALPIPDDVGIDLQNAEEEVMASPEWCWDAQRVGLVLNGTDKELHALHIAQWRIIADVQSTSLESLATWLTGGPTA